MESRMSFDYEGHEKWKRDQRMRFLAVVGALAGLGCLWGLLLALHPL